MHVTLSNMSLTEELPKRDTGEPAGRRREVHMGGGGLTISHPASATTVI